MCRSSFELHGADGGHDQSLRRHRIVIWGKHGVMARSDVSIKRAADRVEYAETAAKYEYLNLSAGEGARD